MNYISLLSADDIAVLCKIITEKEIRKLFQNHFREFSKMKPGFRPSALSDEEIVSLITKNMKRPFLNVFLNTFIKAAIEHISQEKKLLIHSGKSEESALIEAISHSEFSSDPYLYFKLIGEKADENLIEKIRNWVSEDDELDEGSDELENEDAIEQVLTMMEEKIELLNQEKRELRAQLEESANKYNTSEAEHSSERKTLLESNDRLKKQLEETRKKLTVMQAEKQEVDAELLDLRARAVYDDTDKIKDVYSSEFQYVSLCVVSATEYNNNKWLFRLADVSREGQLEDFHADPDKPKYFANRERLFWKDGPSEEGTVGIWNWNATPNNTDSSKDYIVTAFNNVAIPVEEIVIPDCKSASELLTKLKEGINVETSTPRVVFAAYLGKGNFIGFLCSSKELEKEFSKIKLCKSVVSLPKYEFESKDITLLSNGKYYFRNISLGIPVEIVNVKDPLEIVRNVVVSRNTWKVFKEKGKTKNEWRTVIHDFLGELDTKSIAEEVAEASNCSLLEAKKRLNEFIVHASSYIDGSDLEDSIILSVINENQELMDRCKALLFDDWKKENQRKVDDANNKLQDLNNQLIEIREKIDREVIEGKNRVDKQNKDAEERFEKIKNEHDSLVAELQGLRDQIENQRKLAEDVETEVSQKITRAKENAASFIANMAFVTSALKTPDGQLSLVSSSKNTVAEPRNSSLAKYTGGSSLAIEEFEDIRTVDGAVDLITEELIDAGVMDKYARSFAAFLYSSFIERAPILLIGPNATSIADAFSVALFGKTAGVIECEGYYESNILADCRSGKDKVIKIVNPFNASWVSHIPDIVCGQDAYFFAIHPYAEDVQIEPKSLYNYMLPVFTEPVVENSPVEFTMGGYLSSDFIELSKVKPVTAYDKLLKQMKVFPLLRNRISSVLGSMHSILKDKGQDYDVLYGLLPYAYATMQMPILVNAIQDNESKTFSITKDMKALMAGFVGEVE